MLNINHLLENESVISFFLFVCTLVPILIAVAYLILGERKIMASIQRRRGPNVVGIWGLIQPFIDAVKLLTKEHIYPQRANLFLFIFGPILTLTISLFNWAFIPFNENNFYYDFTHSLLCIFAFSSIGIYGLVFSGWASNSRFAILGVIRTISQFISYELILMLTVLPVILITSSLNLIDIVIWQIDSIWFIIPLWPIAYIFFVAALAETNRTPFDLPEAEAELVAGYNIEFASVFFLLFMFAEYNSILVMCALFTILFLGGWDTILIILPIIEEFIFSTKLSGLCFLFITVRATQPRLRFDQLLAFSWKRLLPLSVGLLLLTICVHLTFLYHFWFQSSIISFFVLILLPGIFSLCKTILILIIIADFLNASIDFVYKKGIGIIKVILGYLFYKHVILLFWKPIFSTAIHNFIIIGFILFVIFYIILWFWTTFFIFDIIYSIIWTYCESSLTLWLFVDLLADIFFLFCFLTSAIFIIILIQQSIFFLPFVVWTKQYFASVNIVLKILAFLMSFIP